MRKTTVAPQTARSRVETMSELVMASVQVDVRCGVEEGSWMWEYMGGSDAMSLPDSPPDPPQLEFPVNEMTSILPRLYSENILNMFN